MWANLIPVKTEFHLVTLTRHTKQYLKLLLLFYHLLNFLISNEDSLGTPINYKILLLL